MSNILLVEPDYKSKFPPLGLMRLSTFHKQRGDSVTFSRGKDAKLKEMNWHKVYISTLFTWDLPKTVDTIKYYYSSVERPSDIIVGGIAATLMPDYILNRVECTVITGPLDKANPLAGNLSNVSQLVPDYDLIDQYEYEPKDSYFCRATIGCIRNCGFCAVPLLEPRFGFLKGVKEQIEEVNKIFGERQNLVLLDNNILACKEINEIIDEIKDQGFQRGASRNNKKRTIDFNQGIDARLITTKIAEKLSTVCLEPVRFAFDFDGMEKSYRRAVRYLADVGFNKFTTYVMFNYNDNPASFYHRLTVNIDLSINLGIRVTGFPMRYVPITGVSRNYVSSGWYWRYLRGIQCILHATHGMVSPNPDFFHAAFGRNYEEFTEILAMPDRYIIYREKYSNNLAAEWRALYRKLSSDEKDEFLRLLEQLNKVKDKMELINKNKKYKELLEHYYPNGKSVKE